MSFERRRRLIGLTRRPALRLAAGVLLLVLSSIPLASAGLGLLSRELQRGGQPLRLMVMSPIVRADRHAAAHDSLGEHDDAAIEAAVPGVILVHGFAVSRRIMLGYAHVLAQGGYAVMLVDLPGHGRSERPFAADQLQEAVDHAYQALIAQPEVDAARVALVGHCMGSGVAMRAALAHPARYRATVALSPVDAAVTPATPRNLLLQAGSWEPSFRRTGENLLRRAGGPGGDFANGRARELVVVPAAEHLGILFRTASHQAALAWLDRALEFDPDWRRRLDDRRLPAWLLHVLGWMLVVASMAPTYRRDARRERDLVRAPLQWVAMAASPLLATITLALLGSVLDLRRVGGILVGGSLALWFLLAGILFLALAFRVAPPNGTDVLWGVGLFVFLWFVLGATADFVWLNWRLVPARLTRWPVFALACIPWFAATELTQGGPGERRHARLIAFGLQTSSVCLGLLLLATWSPAMSAVRLIVPVVPLFLGCAVFVGSRFTRPWAYGIGCGLFFGWLLASAFPLLV